MTDSAINNAESHESLKSLIQEYKNREYIYDAPSCAGAKIGDVWFSLITQKLYVCNGKVDGKFIWSCVN